MFRTPKYFPIVFFLSQSVAEKDGKLEDRKNPGEPIYDPYGEDFQIFLRQNELKYRPRIDYMNTVQRDINFTMRGILIDWLVEVAQEYKLRPQTLFLTVHYIDRLLSITAVRRTKLQLVGITCMLIAAKYEEIYPPAIDEFVYISDSTYTKEEVLAMESFFLTSVKFGLTNVTPLQFAMRYACVVFMDQKTQTLVRYLLELTLQEQYYVCQFLPSQIASAAVFLAFHTLQLPSWPQAIATASGHSIADIRECVVALHDSHVKIFLGTTMLKAVKTKYSDSRLDAVALIPPAASIP